MTKPPRGSSLAQARDLMNNKHSHFHQHRRDQDHPQPQQHHHQHRHVEDQSPQHPHQHNERQVPGEAADAPAIVDSHITRVIQTISVVQIIDGAGNPIEVQTHFAEPATFLVDPVSGVTISALSLGAAGVAPTSEPDAGIPSYDAETVSPSPAPVPAPTPEYSNIPGDIAESTSALPALESSELPVPVQSLDDISTSVPYVAAAEPSAYPTIGAAVNSTLPSSFHSLPPNNSSSVRLFAVPESSSQSTTTTSYSSISNRRSSSLFTTTTTFFASSTTASSAEGTVEPTAVVGGGAGGNGEGDAAAAPSAAAENTDDSTPETGVIVGSVFGSIAGLALVAVLVLLALRWKKRNGGRIALGEDMNRGTRGLPAAGGASDDAARPPMTQRSMSWGAGALAGIGAKRASRNAPPPPPSPPAESGERGFYRVSGRKLPSVLASGGDGYSDPNENPFGNQNRSSAMSGDSVLYRDSQGFFDEPTPNDALGRLAVGSPMRPVSGVPIMRSGPAKTPVTESNPFADPGAPVLQPPPPSRDAIGRSLGSQDGSRGSGSRFTEEIR
ncbi:hypothetical protein F5X68DRAFT_15472 [Plectosphaerella plurivora]|uniref:Uncharacterized protein n=1 Tax=Plectosphaerella plurivora TaxID=936078 RepID=A0A9P8VBP3_9PEZI|nr:hypothetical protein F5X68DRAFT_15472 [Plectosphaerella plurivora]